ncbi:MAG: CinA family protein [Rickettsiaceae bacterium]|nr:CinA family protein [Rickettsiaceae bacterium]
MTDKILINLASQIKTACDNKYSIATAESCTGGMLAGFLTAIAGSSNYLYGGFVTYSNQAKIDMLGVKSPSLEQYGAVSKQVALEMAIGARVKSNSFLAASITGIAGHSGGTKTKPVGTVWFGIALKNGAYDHVEHFTGNREQIRLNSCKTAMELILKYIPKTNEKPVITSRL